MTISPQDLSGEERAIWDALAIREFPSFGATHAYAQTKGAMECVVLARRALFTPESEMPAQADTLDVDCSVCAQPGYGDHDCPQPAPVAAGEISELDDRHMRLASPEAQAKFREAHGLSRPVQPGDCENCESLIAERDELRDQLDRIPDSQPVAAGEMPFLLRQAAAELRSASVLNVRDGHPEAATAQRWTADALERWWRSQPAPVAAVRMTPELEEVLSAAWLWSIEPPADTEKIRDAIHAVRDQAAAQPGKMVKVRDLIVFARANAQYLKDSLNESEGNYVREMMHDKIDAALAELDSYEGKVGG